MIKPLFMPPKRNGGSRGFTPPDSNASDDHRRRRRLAKEAGFLQLSTLENGARLDSTTVSPNTGTDESLSMAKSPHMTLRTPSPTGDSHQSSDSCHLEGVLHHLNPGCFNYEVYAEHRPLSKNSVTSLGLKQIRVKRSFVVEKQSMGETDSGEALEWNPFPRKDGDAY